MELTAAFRIGKPTGGIVRNKRSARWLISSGTAIAACLATGYLLGGKHSGAVHADSGVTTEQAASQAGAKFLPSDARLKIEPK
ncbi:hypothetical protein QRQ56_30695 [Bradyrhizobium sp. U531]|uniref:hypothetical protein n=1 Tax=Bradyrhizobium sp. U531 TaxID=3053458 RepID=UPI003F426783